MATVTSGRATDFITFSRPGATGGGATVTDRDGKIKWAGHNLLTNSESFDAISWTKDGGSSVTANTVVAPNGTTTADTLTDSAVAGQQRAYQAVNVIAGQIVTLAVFLKQGTRRYARVTLNNGNDASVVADLQVGTITQYAHPDWTIHGTSITPIGDSWYRVSITASRAAVTQYYAVVAACNVASGISDGYSYTGNGSTIHLWGAHLYRSDLGGMVLNPARGDAYYPTTPRNLLGFTEDFFGTGWSRVNLLANGSGSVANAAVAPNGLQTADLLIESTANGYHSVYRSFTSVANTPYLWSAYVKPAGRTIVQIAAQATGTVNIVEFSLTGSGTATTRSGSGTAAITALSDGWYRISTIATANASGTAYWQVDLCSAANTNIYTGNGTSGIYLWGAQLSDSASLDAYSPVYGAAVTSAAYYAPRLDFDPVTLAAKGLLVEEARTNFLLNSSAFGSWSLGDVTVTADNTAAPDGTSTADRLVYGSTGAYVFQDYNTTTAGAYTFSLYMRADSPTTVKIGCRENAIGADAVVCSLTTQWQRFTITRTASGSVTSMRCLIVTDSNTPTIYAWGAQLEAGSFATSLIPTGASTATRTVDVASVSTQAFPYSATEGTLVVNVVSNISTAYAVGLSDGTANNFVFARYGTSGTAAVIVASSVTQANIGSTATTAKMAIAFKADDFAVSVNGGAAATDTSGSVPSVNILNIGADGTAANVVNGWVRQITYLPRRLSNSELQARTA